MATPHTPRPAGSRLAACRRPRIRDCSRTDRALVFRRTSTPGITLSPGSNGSAIHPEIESGGFQGSPAEPFCQQRSAKPGRTVPCISVPCLSSPARPVITLPVRGLRCQDRACGAGPCLANPRQAYPSLPDRARPSLVSPIIACIAGPCPSVPPMPIQTCRAVPVRALLYLTGLCLPRRAGPRQALPFHACRAEPRSVEPCLTQPAMRRQPRLRWPPISGRTCEDANTVPSAH